MTINQNSQKRFYVCDTTNGLLENVSTLKEAEKLYNTYVKEGAKAEEEYSEEKNHTQIVEKVQSFYEILELSHTEAVEYGFESV